MHCPPARHASFREPARRRGRGSALRLAERWSAKAKRYENAPVGAFSAEGSASHLAHLILFHPGRHTSFREPARRRGKRISRRGVAAGRGVRCFAVATRIPRLPMRFRLRRASRRSRWFASGSVSPRLEGTRIRAKCVWKRHGVTFHAGGSALRLAERWSAKAKRYENAPAARFPRRASPGEVSPPVEECVASQSPRGSHAFRCVSGYAAIRVARDGSLQEPWLHGWRWARLSGADKEHRFAERSSPRQTRRHHHGGLASMFCGAANLAGPPTRQPRWGGSGYSETREPQAERRREHVVKATHQTAGPQRGSRV